MTSTVNVFVVSPNTRSERRFDLHITVEQLKAKLELITGISAQNQRIYIESGDGHTTGELTDHSRQLGYYGLKDLQTLKIVDTNPSTSIMGQLSDVEKFELSDEAYANRPDTVLSYMQRHEMGRFASQSKSPVPMASVAIPVGARCEVKSTEEGLCKRGTVRFVGPTQFSKTGIWVGVEYDEPIGRNDGSVQGERYFTCRPNYGVFVRSDRMTVGDFPVEDINFDDEEM